MLDGHSGARPGPVADAQVDPRLLFWTQDEPVRNFGDLLSSYIATKGLIAPLFPADRYRLIGSAIDEAVLSADIRRAGGGDVTIACWGCGARGFAKLSEATRESIALFGLRGPLSRAALAMPEDTPLGDPALMLPLLYKPRAPSSQGLGEVLCVPHFNEPLSNQEVLYRTGADAILSPHVRDLVDCERLIDRIANAEFVLAGSLHAAIVSFAYGTPFAFLDVGFVDVPFKWQDFAALIGIEPVWCGSVAEARGRAQRNLKEAFWPALLPLLAVCPWAVRPDVLLAARGLDDDHGHVIELQSDDIHAERVRVAHLKALQHTRRRMVSAASQQAQAVAAALNTVCVELGTMQIELQSRAAAAEFNFAPELADARALTFTAGSAGSAMLHGPWVAANEVGPITLGSHSRIIVPAATGWERGAELVIEGLVYAPPATELNGRRNIRVFINGSEALSWDAVNPGQEASFLECMRIPLANGHRERGGDLEVHFVFSEQVSPLSLGLSEHDDRLIGLVPLRLWIK
jgi:hypothetical protein